MPNTAGVVLNNEKVIGTCIGIPVRSSIGGIEPNTPNSLQLYNIIRYNYNTKIANGTGVMRQFF